MTDFLKIKSKQITILDIIIATIKRKKYKKIIYNSMENEEMRIIKSIKKGNLEYVYEVKIYDTIPRAYRDRKRHDNKNTMRVSIPKSK